MIVTTNRMQAPAGTVLYVAGELDTFAADDLRERLRSLPLGPDEQLVVDLSAVTFMSCTALSVLVEARARLGSRLLMGRSSSVVTRLLDLTALTPLFPVASGDGAGPVPRERAGSGNGGPTPIHATEPQAWTFSRTDVHRVRGLLMAVHGCDAEQAWSMLALTAARHHVPVGELVELLIRPDSDRTPSSAAALAALTVLMRKPTDDDGDPSAADADRVVPSSG